jgi:hypothetical protein
MDVVNYYIQLLASLCGFSTTDSITRSGSAVVIFATFVLIYAFYRAIYVAIWPGEANIDHIKRRVLMEEDVRDEN